MCTRSRRFSDSRFRGDIRHPPARHDKQHGIIIAGGPVGKLRKQAAAAAVRESVILPSREISRQSSWARWRDNEEGGRTFMNWVICWDMQKPVPTELLNVGFILRARAGGVSPNRSPTIKISFPMVYTNERLRRGKLILLRDPLDDGQRLKEVPCQSSPSSLSR